MGEQSAYTKPPADHKESIGERQMRFLLAWDESMTEKQTCAKTGISLSSFYRWIKDDVNGFAGKWHEIERMRGYYLEAALFEVIKWVTDEEARYKMLLQYPTLFQTALKAAWPDKYGDKLTASQDDARQIIEKLGKMGDDPKPKPTDNVQSIDSQLDDILG